MRPRAGAAWLAAIASPLALASSPGRMPADSKLYLYLDPAGWLGRAATTWDTSQFAGFVPHQQIAYLWPAGPWFWLFDALRVPDWVAHRLWIATLLTLAGTGVMWFARTLGLRRHAALASGALYMLSPYVLAYVSRTSVMLLPWAGLGWVLGCTWFAVREGGWRWPARAALVVLTIGSTNATALMMITPAPVLLLAHLGLDGAGWGRVGRVALRTSALCTAVSAWWVAMLVVQGRFGADVLAYTETLEAVSSTSTSPEAVRGLGYWLNYGRDHVQATTTAAADYHTATWLLVLGFGLVVVGVVGIAAVRWAHRRFLALCLLAGIVLGVGAYPIDRPAPLFAAFGEHSRSTVALALRSSTRALPVALLALALGTGALVSTVRAPARRTLASWATVALALANLPALWGRHLVDPSLERDEDPPAAWVEAARALDALPAGYRVLQLPGAEFGAFRWGYTVDPPLPGLTTRPLVTRDLQPLGSAGAMDLLYALDDRLQNGVADIAAVAPVARLLGADVVWVSGDMAFERFRTPRPEPTEAAFEEGARGLGEPEPFGEAAVNHPAVPMVDEQSIADSRVGTPVYPVLLVPVVDPVGIVRVKTTMVVLAGSGDGIVDAAAAGLIDGHELVLYAASLTPGELAERVAQAALVVLTDSNRDRAHQWRGSQGVVGFTEDGGAGSGVGRFDSQDSRLPVFTVSGPEHQTVAVQEGPVSAHASAYGTRLEYWPEYRAAMAVDGDPATAWKVAAEGDPRGEWLQVDTATPVSRLVVTQPSGDRRIAEVEVHAGGLAPFRAALDAEAPTEITLPAPATQVRLVVRAVTPGTDPVGFAEVDAGLGPTREVTILPSVAVAAGRPLGVVLTRERVRATDRRRADPDPDLTRRFDAPGGSYDLAVTARLDPRAGDALGPLLGAPFATASSVLAGTPAHAAWAAVDGDDATTWVSAVGTGAGAWLEVEPDSGITELTLIQPDRDDLAAIRRVRVERAGAAAETEVAGPDVTVGVPPGDGPVRITVLATDGATTIDRVTGRTVALPVAVAEVRAPGLGQPLPEQIDTGCRSDLLTLDDTAVELRLTGATAALLAGQPFSVTPCASSTVELAAGAHEVVTARHAGLTVDRVVLTSAGLRLPDARADTVAAAPARHGRTVLAPSCATTCWLVLGEGWSTGWSAHGARVLDVSPQMVDGGFNGWLLAPGDAELIDLRWAGQLPVDLALAASAAVAAPCLLMASRRRPHRPWPHAATLDRDRLGVRHAARLPLRRAAAAWLAGTLAAFALISALAAALAAVVLAAALLVGRRAVLVAWAALAGVVVSAGYVVAQALRLRPEPGAPFLAATSDAHQPLLVALVLLAMWAVLAHRDGGAAAR